MTPAARYAAAITILDAIESGELAERAITGWGRQNRFAGSKDRAGIRDHVFDVLRTKRSCAKIGGGNTGRELILGHLRNTKIDPEVVFTGEGYAPSALTEQELQIPSTTPTDAESHDLPDWAWEKWQAALGDSASGAAYSQRTRAPVALRINQRRTTREKVALFLAEDGIETEEHPSVSTCLLVKSNPRRVAQSRAYLNGFVELQDASSQSAVGTLQLNKGQRILDYCAGGGGKSLAIVDQYNVSVSAYDIAPKRMADIPKRAARAGVKLDVLDDAKLLNSPQFDAVFCDAPCSGSGTWRRTPDAKWRLTKEEFEAFPELQADVINAASKFVVLGGLLIYATCSVFTSENSEIIKRFLADNRDFSKQSDKLIVPQSELDGFYLCVLQKN